MKKETKAKRFLESDCKGSNAGSRDKGREKKRALAKLTVSNYVKGQTGDRTLVVQNTDKGGLCSLKRSTLFVRESNLSVCIDE